MRKILLSLLLTAALLLSACAAQDTPAVQTEPTEYVPQPYRAITAIDHAVTEPDERAAMTDDDREQFRVLMEAMLAREPEIVLDTDEERMDLFTELLRESPYYFFVSDMTVSDTSVRFAYAYGEEEQRRMLTFMDEELLRIANSDASPDDNELDVILKVYAAVCGRIEYDTRREDNKQLGSPLFDYPADELYKALRDGRGLCYGFAYVLRCALLQRGIDAFCVYGQCRARDMGHEWVIFRLDGAYFHCDPAWDRASDEAAKLLHFGTTDLERENDTLEMRPFGEYHLSGYGAVRCTDKRFDIFRSVFRFTWLDGHRYLLEDKNGGRTIFNSEDFSLTEE